MSNLLRFNSLNLRIANTRKTPEERNRRQLEGERRLQVWLEERPERLQLPSEQLSSSEYVQKHISKPAIQLVHPKRG